MRSGPGISYKPLKVIQKKDTVELLETINSNWVKIKHRELVGFTSSQYFKEFEEKTDLIKDDNKQNLNDDNSFYQVLLGFCFVLGIIYFVSKSGKKHRDRYIASTLALFLGIFGFQKFYLGQKKGGIISLLFCWTPFPFLIGLIDFFKLVIMKKKDFNNKYNNTTLKNDSIINYKSFQDEKEELEKNKTIHYNVDNTIIDVNSEILDLSIEKDTAIEVPYWSHTYVYSYNEINNANQQQKNFYKYFRKLFLKGEFVNIQGFTNYAFILYFDLLNDYEDNKDIKLLEERFKFLGEICPKTKSYSLMSLKDLLKNRNDSYSITKLQNLQNSSYQYEYGYSDYDPDEYKLGKKYKDELGLSKQEVAWLNKFRKQSNGFTNIKGCLIAVIKQYIFILKESNKHLNAKDSSITKEVNYFKEKITKFYKTRNNSEQVYYDISYSNQRIESDTYLTIFRRVENSVRKNFGHKKSLSEDFLFYDNNINQEIEKRIGDIIKELIKEFKSQIEEPDILTQVELNGQNVNRWKIEFADLKNSFQIEKKDIFIKGISDLEEANKKCSNIENIFYEASKFISKHDDVQALKYYATYIYYDLNSKKFNNKQLMNSVKKSLFKTEEQLTEFTVIIEELIRTRNIESALESISKIYIPKRKKILLNKTEIKEVEHKHSGTVELLNEYLNEDDGVESKENKEVELAFISSSKKSSIFKPELRINDIQEKLLLKIANNLFLIHQDEVDKFALENGLFKNQLVDSINEICEDYLEGEVLIEEDEENYIIEESYYKEIVL
ncbi:tellurite resistance TerB C-terminal domain-containing protein [Lutibacter citreus]|uniref:tellurite resistance TerB C-terminal domain-containing protein n=1 Tax=Lutibacter citreus TaxID=2138210 RepID=UPI0015D0416F|nr:tellurite resistance TerB C-terminal domain-containing protein [Lutibacter citreus]